MARRTTKARAAKAAAPVAADPIPGEPRSGDPVDTALRLAGQLGWQNLSLADIAAESGMKMSALFPRYPSKTALLVAFMARIDAAMLDSIADEPADEPLRDRLFSAIMARFDGLQPHRDGVLSVARASTRDPLAGLCLAAGPLRRSLDALLAASGLPADGLAGAMRRKAMGAIYLAAFRSWMHDDSEDMGPTMAALDRLLTRWLPLMERVGALGRHAAAGPGPRSRSGSGDRDGAAATPAG